jgi:hypothetical protein
MDCEGPAEHRWAKRPSCLYKSFHFKEYTSALTFAGKENEMSTIMDHHVNMSFSHTCVDGVNRNTSCLVLGQFDLVPLMVGEGKNASRQRAL